MVPDMHQRLHGEQSILRTTRRHDSIFLLGTCAKVLGPVERNKKMTSSFSMQRMKHYHQLMVSRRLGLLVKTKEMTSLKKKVLPLLVSANRLDNILFALSDFLGKTPGHVIHMISKSLPPFLLLE
mmetsp:Transcript_45831/g.106514  ORF Transcript_45831/g.106514 Transcript_45831/m.106514 type:complete len:125 (-) Transcript_45831:835-1209(-)